MPDNAHDRPWRAFECRECHRTPGDVRAGVEAPGGGCSRCEDALMDAKMELADLDRDDDDA